eukprot:TRINITY_DN13734_c0_g1_i2.p1 TRINITY_DN13734_c0_g1~~TRINITY_DN13734_c0_g1_i2.p1  ORF type:complete len:904 (+),score=148.35 TRINITY_DN13734_c0_g1_i2:208-2919(+)
MAKAAASSQPAKVVQRAASTAIPLMTPGSPSGPPKQFGRWVRGAELGHGAYSQVFECREVEGDDAQVFAAKIIRTRALRLSANPEREQKKMRREVVILKNLPPHPNVVRMVDAIDEDYWLILVLELVTGGDLFGALVRRPGPRPHFHDREAAFVTRQLTEGLMFLHSRGIVHRDLKLENVLIASVEFGDRGRLMFYNVKITDFGLSKVMGEGLSEPHSMVGTRRYVAPEVLHGSVYDNRVDLWSLGIILYLLIDGRYPHDIPGQANQESLDTASERIAANKAVQDLISGLMRVKAELRLSLSELRAHPWLQPTWVADEGTVDDSSSSGCVPGLSVTECHDRSTASLFGSESASDAGVLFAPGAPLPSLSFGPSLVGLGTSTPSRLGTVAGRSCRMASSALLGCPSWIQRDMDEFCGAGAGGLGDGDASGQRRDGELAGASPDSSVPLASAVTVLDSTSDTAAPEAPGSAGSSPSGGPAPSPSVPSGPTEPVAAPASPSNVPAPQTASGLRQRSGVLVPRKRWGSVDAAPTAEDSSATASWAGRTTTASRTWIDLSLVQPAGQNPAEMQLHLVVSENMAGAILGKGGEDLRRTARTAGCTVKMTPRAGDADRHAVIRGQASQCMVALGLVQDQLAEAFREAGQQMNEVTTVFAIPEDLVGLVIGKEGSNLKQLSQQSGAAINVVRQVVEGHRPCIIQGVPRSVLSAVWMTFELLRNMTPKEPAAKPAVERAPATGQEEAAKTESVSKKPRVDDAALTTTLLIPTPVVAKVIGKKGDTLRQIHEQHNVQVEVLHQWRAPEYPTDRVVTLRGSLSARQAAVVHVLRIAFPEGEPCCLQLLVPAAKAGTVIGRGGSFLKHLHKQCGIWAHVVRDQDQSGQRLVTATGTHSQVSDVVAALLQLLNASV